MTDLDRIAAAIALAELDPRGESWRDLAEIWSEIDEGPFREEYRRMARSAKAEIARQSA